MNSLSAVHLSSRIKVIFYTFWTESVEIFMVVLTIFLIFDLLFKLVLSIY